MAPTRDDGSDMSSGEESYDFVSHGDQNDLRSDYFGSADFQSDNFHTDDSRTDDFLSEEILSEDFHSTCESRADDVLDNLNTGNAMPVGSSTNFRSNRYGEGEITQFFQGMAFDGNSDLTQRRDARATSANTSAYEANFPPTLSALPDLAANGNDLISSYNQSGSIAQPLARTNNYGREVGFDEFSYYGQFVPSPPFTGQALPGQDRRWTTDDPPWNHLLSSGMRETTLSSGYTYANPVPSSTTCSTSAFTPSESGPSSSSYFAGVEASNTSADVYGQDMAESQATLRASVHDSGPGSNNGPRFADTTWWDPNEQPDIANQATTYSHVGTQMRGTTGARSGRSGHTDHEVHISRQNSTASGRTRAQARADHVEDLSCPHCDAIFHGTHQRGSLHRHMRMKHSTRLEEGTVTYPCEAAGCSKIFMRMDARLKHHRKWHEHLNVPPPKRRK